MGGTQGTPLLWGGSDINWKLPFPKELALTSELESNLLLCASRSQWILPIENPFLL